MPSRPIILEMHKLCDVEILSKLGLLILLLQSLHNLCVQCILIP